MSNPNPDQSGLRPWPKGVSGNPKGRPRRPDVAALNKLIDEIGAEGGIAALWLKKALGDRKTGEQPDFAYFKLLIEHRNGVAAKKDGDDGGGGSSAPHHVTIEFVNAPEPSHQDPTAE